MPGLITCPVCFQATPWLACLACLPSLYAHRYVSCPCSTCDSRLHPSNPSCCNPLCSECRFLCLSLSQLSFGGTHCMISEIAREKGRRSEHCFSAAAIGLRNHGQFAYALRFSGQRSLAAKLSGECRGSFPHSKIPRVQIPEVLDLTDGKCHAARRSGGGQARGSQRWQNWHTGPLLQPSSGAFLHVKKNEN